MKTKTFEELIEEKFAIRKNEVCNVHFDELLELLELVRISTITECKDLYEQDWGKYIGYKKMEALPTDKIKIKE